MATKPKYKSQSRWQSTPKEKARRAARGRARYHYEKKHGDLPRSAEIEHKDGNAENNKPSNLIVKSSAFQRSQGGRKGNPKNKGPGNRKK
jgi:ribosomal protein L34E